MTVPKMAHRAELLLAEYRKVLWGDEDRRMMTRENSGKPKAPPVLDWLTWETLTDKLCKYIHINKKFFLLNQQLKRDLEKEKATTKELRKSMVSKSNSIKHLSECSAQDFVRLKALQDVINRQASVIEENRRENSNLVRLVNQQRAEVNVLHIERDRLIDKLEEMKLRNG